MTQSPPNSWYNKSMTKAPEPKRHVVFDLNEFGVAMMEQNLRRKRPTDSDEQIARALHEWQLSRPYAPGGDASGVPSHRFDGA